MAGRPPPLKRPAGNLVFAPTGAAPRTAPAVRAGAGATLADRMPHTNQAAGDTRVESPPRTEG